MSAPLSPPSSPLSLDLAEWQTLGPGDDGRLAGRGLEGKEAGRLAAALTRSGQLEVLELARGLQVRATSFVGRVRLGNLTVTVRPKLPGPTLLHLLRYAYGLRELDLLGPEVALPTAAWNFEELLIHQLRLEAGELLARGLTRDYRRTEADLASPRGRIDFVRYAAQVAPSGRAVLPCVEHPRSEDTALNRALLGGLILASRRTADPDLRAGVQPLVRVLSATVHVVRPLDAVTLREARRRLDRRTSTYAPALTLVDLLLSHQGVSLEEPDGEGAAPSVPLPGFLYDMNRFFQALLSRFLHEHLPADCEVRDEHRLRGMLTFDPGRNPRGWTPPTPRPDFAVLRAGKVVALLDAKYRDLWQRRLPREMLYQLALYALSRPGPSRVAVILYPTLEAAARDQAVVIREPGGGLAQAEVVLRAVYLPGLEALLRERDGAAKRRRAENLAGWLAFGTL